MIDIYRSTWLSYVGYCQKYQLQVDTVDDFNQKIGEIQLELFSLLNPHYQKNEFVRALLAPFVRRIYDVSDQSGQLDHPQRVGWEEETTETFCRILGFSVTDAQSNPLFPILQTQENEIIGLTLIPQRAPNITKRSAYYLAYDKYIQLYPETSIDYLLFYLVYPQAAILAFTYILEGGEYVQVFDSNNTVNLSWDMNASNLILYMLLEKYGFTTRDDTMQKFGEAGLEINMTIPQPQPVQQ